MSRKCDCGNELPKTKGTYLEMCRECYGELVPTERHKTECELDGCEICNSKLKEMQAVVQPLYVYCLTQATEHVREKTLGDFE